MNDRVRVLFDTRESNWKDNPYIALLAQSVAAQIEVVGFSWRTLLTGKFDAFHVHWPEHLISQPSISRRAVVRMLFALGIVRLRVRRIPVVRTMHNRTAHFQVAWIETALLRQFERLVVSRIWLSDREDEETIRSESDVVIPHSDYTPWLSAFQRPADAPGNGQQILCFGVFRRYKRFEEVASATVELGYPHLTIAGFPTERDYAGELTAMALENPNRLTVIARRLESAELVAAIGAANLVIVPYADLYNSGVILLTLSLQRPVALRDSPAARTLAAEYGNYWVRRYPGALTSESLDNVLNVGTTPPSAAFSAKRLWSFAAEKHVAVYQRVIHPQE